MSQSKKMSMLEVACNQITGFLLAMATFEFIIEPLFDIEKTHGENFWMVCIFTATSMIRSYIWRRIFNREPPKPIYIPMHPNCVCSLSEWYEVDGEEIHVSQIEQRNEEERSQ